MRPLTPKPILTTIIKKRMSTMRKITKHFIQGRDQNRCFWSRYPPTNQTGFNRYSPSQSNCSNNNWRSPNIENRKTTPRQPKRWAICDSFNYWQQQCPDKDKVKHKTYISDKVMFHQNDYDSLTNWSFSWQKAGVLHYLTVVQAKQFAERFG